MKKKIIIKGLKFNLQIPNITIGEALVPEGEHVEKIVYEDHYYNKGYQGRFSAYVVFFADSNIRHIIRETEISTVVVEAQDIEDKQEIPDLPEEQVEAEKPEKNVEAIKRGMPTNMQQII